MKHPGHTYGGFIPAISEQGVTMKSMFYERQQLAASERALEKACMKHDTDRSRADAAW
jgi:hypothetical protein